MSAKWQAAQLCVCVLAAMLVARSAFAAPVVAESKLVPAPATTDARFGFSVACHANTIVVGSVLPHAFVFVRKGTVWTQQGELTPDDAPPGDFGYAVAVHDDLAVVGSPGGDAVYVFARSGGVWSQQDKITPADVPAGARFGHAVAIHETTIVIGAPAVGNGAAFVYVLEGDVWALQDELVAGGTADGDRFGAAVDIHGDHAVVGAPKASNEAGAAFVFLRTGSSWSEEQQLPADPGTDQFGFSVAVDDRTTLVGSPFANHSGESNAGKASVFVREGGGWVLEQELFSSTPAFGARFGISVSLEGNTALVAATHDLAFAGADDVQGFVFARDGQNWFQYERLETGSGLQFAKENVFTALCGCTPVVGAELDDELAPNAGAAFAYLLDNCECTDPPDGLVSWWTLNEIVGPTSVDVEGDNDGAWVTDPTPVDGMVHGALRFAGHQQHVTVPDHPSLDFGTGRDFSLDAWVFPVQDLPAQPVVDKRDAATGAGYALRLTDGRVSVFWSDGAGTAPAYTSDAPIPLLEWSHLAVAVDRSADLGQVYINGALDGTFVPSATAAGSIDNDDPLLIGRGTEDDPYIGLIDEVQVFDRAVEQAEIQRVHDALTGGKCHCAPIDPFPVAWWTMDEISEPIAVDIAGAEAGTPHDGVYIGDPPPADGKVGGAQAFNGVGQRVEVADHDELDFDPARNFSIDAWIRPSSVEGVRTIVAKWDDEARIGYRLFLRSGHVVFEMNDGTQPFQVSHVSPRVVPTDRWTMIAVTVDWVTDEGRLYLAPMPSPPPAPANPYLDGNFKPSDSATGSLANDRPLFVAGDPAGDHEHFSGRIDEVEIYDRSLSPNEFGAIYAGDREGKCRPEPVMAQSTCGLSRD